MSYLVFARWFGLVSIILSFGILFNLEDAKEMAKNLVKRETGYILGGVLPIIFGCLALTFVNDIEMSWRIVITFVGTAMVLAGAFRVICVRQWKMLMYANVEQIPFLFSLFGLMFGCILLYVGFIAPNFQHDSRAISTASNEMVKPSVTVA